MHTRLLVCRRWCVARCACTLPRSDAPAQTRWCPAFSAPERKLSHKKVRSQKMSFLHSCMKFRRSYLCGRAFLCESILYIFPLLDSVTQIPCECHSVELPGFAVTVKVCLNQSTHEVVRLMRIFVQWVLWDGKPTKWPCVADIIREFLAEFVLIGVYSMWRFYQDILKYLQIKKWPTRMVLFRSCSIGIIDCKNAILYSAFSFLNYFNGASNATCL